MPKLTSTADFRRAKPANKVSKSKALFDRASNSRFLDKSNPSIEALKTRADALEKAETEKESAKKVWQAKAKAARKEKSELDAATDTYANYVEEVAKGKEGLEQEEIFNDCGLSLKPKAEDLKSLDFPKNLQVVQGRESGHLLISFDRVQHAHHYEIFGSITPDDESSFRLLNSTASTRDNDVNSFKRGETAGIKVKAVGRKGVVSPLSDAVSKFVS